MSQVWLQIFAVMIIGSMIKYFFFHPLIAVLVEFAVLGTAYLILRRHPYVDMRTSMLFLGGLTLISILTDIGVLGGLMGNLLVLALLAWMMLGRGNSGGGGMRGPVRRSTSVRHKWHK